MPDLLKKLIELSENMARGRYERHAELFELTKRGTYPEEVRRLAESFGMMMVKVEAREFHLSQIIEDLQQARIELSAAKRHLTAENQGLKNTLRKTVSPERILGTSEAIRRVRETIKRLAAKPISVLITGETGTGKELVAQAIHYGSNRAERPFVAINCSAIPETMLESELFGIEKGVATGVDRRIGKFEQADGGTLFLDEVGEMPLAAQSKVLRALETRTVERVGSRTSHPIDIRVLAATNKDLAVEVDRGKFRSDLYYRLNVVHVPVPPLRDRKEDIPVLFETFVKISAAIQGTPPLQIQPGLLSLLADHPWPGNVRQLKNEVDRAVALATSGSITMDDLSPEVCDYFSAPATALRESLPGETLQRREMDILHRALADAGGNKSEAARRLGLSREGLRKKLKRYALSGDE